LYGHFDWAARVASRCDHHAIRWADHHPMTDVGQTSSAC
jgi:hypothetical protein